MEWLSKNWFFVVLWAAFVAMHLFGHGGHGGHGGHSSHRPRRDREPGNAARTLGDDSPVNGREPTQPPRHDHGA